MKRLLWLFALPMIIAAGAAVSARAEKHISVAQLDKTIALVSALPDGEAAHRLSDLQLTERLSPERLDALSKLLPGEQSRYALWAIADPSQFLSPPVSELAGNPAPSFSEQRRIMGLVAGYVEHAIPQLPNFFATRITDHFEDAPLIQRPGQSSMPYQALHFTARTEASVFYQKGREVVDVKAGSRRPGVSSQGLTTWGVFGPILGTVLVDAATSKLEWSHWERESNGPVAVFNFHVAQEKSHYEINYCCIASQAATVAANVGSFRRIVPYHGSMTVDPSSGVILRLLVEAELKSSDPVAKAAILVEYGPVEIGSKTYTCPILSLSTTTAEVVQVDPQYRFALANQVQPLKTSLNHVTFTNYHMFRSDVRILSPEEADLVQQAKTRSGEVASASDQPAEPSIPETPLASAPMAPSATAPPVKPEEPAISEIATSAATALPDIPSTSAPSVADTGYRLSTTTRLVEVTVVAFDKKGHPITDLKSDNFEVYDNGRKQTVRTLSQAAGETASLPVADAAKSNPESGKRTFSNRPAERSSTPTVSPQRESTNTTVFLIDSSHVSFGDLTHARNEMLRFLKTLSADAPVALYVLRKHGFEVLREPTADHDQIAATLRNWMPSAQDLSQAASEEMRNRQQMEYVRDSHDLLAMNGKTPTGSDDYQSAPDMQRRSLGDTPEQNALQYLIWVARHVAAFKGHKSLIWVASDNVLADFSEKAPQNEQGDKYLEPLALRAREALNEAQVSIYPLDSSQLEAGVVTANLQHANVQVNPTATASQEISPSGSTIKPGDTSAREDLQAMKQAQRDINPGRLTAQLQQDAHPIQGTFRELAEATGGRALRRASDIAAELDSIVNDGRAAYTLSFSPDTPADGTYHHLTVKLTDRRGVNLRYRTGYLYEKEAATLKERFQNAVWRPADVSEIALTAIPSLETEPPSLKLNIAAADLALAEQAGLWMDKLDIFLVQRDDAMFHARLNGQTLGLRLKPSTYQQVLKDGINIDEPIKRLPDTGALRIVVVDENTGRIGTVTLPASALKK